MTSAPAITPYMWKLWKRNISWMRNQEMTSPFVITTPKRIPTRK